jgi:RHS repeat-associated protein
MRSQLTDASISNINGSNPWSANCSYKPNGNICQKISTCPNTVKIYRYDTTLGGDYYDSDIMTSATGSYSTNFTLTWDKNGQLTFKNMVIGNGNDTSFVWNWEGQLRQATKGSTTINLKYDPAGNRIAKDVNVSQTLTARKYIVDIVGELPTILLEINPSGGSIMKTYVYANSQILAQHNGNYNAPRYFYLHDRLGSFRLVINSAGDVNNTYTYNPFGEMFASECNETVSNQFKFTGQFYDSETGQYYLRARMYDPPLMRFISRDPVFGKFEEPLTLHKYLYCLNNPINRIDPTGLWVPGVHRQISYAAFTGPSIFIEPSIFRLSDDEKRYVEQGSEYVDTFQSPEDAYMHAMRTGRRNGNSQTVAQAEKLMRRFIYKYLFIYKEIESLDAGSSAYHGLALQNLGMAMHPVMDSTSPSHTGFQPWFGDENTFELLAHVSVEKSISPETRQITVNLMHEEITNFEKRYSLINKLNDWPWSW